MIYYFSATGNCKYVASRIAAATGEQAVDIEECLREGKYRFSLDGERVGIVTPVYFWNIPFLVADFLSKASFEGASYRYCVVTYGTTTGNVAARIQEFLPLDAEYGLKMPDTWTHLFDLSDAEKVQAQNRAADVALETVIDRICRRTGGDFNRTKKPDLACRFGKWYYDRSRKTSHFTVRADCTGCSRCARDCPIQAIRMEGHRPVWVSDRCLLCLRCLHHCPQFAIQYSSRTYRHGQYTHP